MDYLAALVGLVGSLVSIHIFKLSRKNKRLDDFEKRFYEIYKNDGCVLECLMPAGVASLENNKEIEKGLRRLESRLGFRPLRSWHNDVKKIGYKTFFKRVVGPGHGLLNKNTIQDIINSFESS